MTEIQITFDLIEEFLSALAENGRKKQSIQVYRRTLKRWYNSLPEDKLASEASLDRWGVMLREQGIADNSIANTLSTVKLFLKYLESPGAIQQKVSYQQKKEAAQEHALTRSEYQLLLHAAKKSGFRRTYLLIKTIGGLGIRSTEIQELTVDHVKQGEMAIASRGGVRTVKISEPIRSDLLAFIAETEIETGPVFITKEGLPLQHFLIWKQIKKVCRQMGFPEDKGTPSSLYDMYWETRNSLPVKSVEEADQEYLAFLQEEESTIGWDNAGVQQTVVLEEESISPSDIVVKTSGVELRSEEKELLAKKVRELLSETLSNRYTCEVMIRLT